LLEPLYIEFGTASRRADEPEVGVCLGNLCFHCAAVVLLCALVLLVPCPSLARSVLGVWTFSRACHSILDLFWVLMSARHTLFCRFARTRTAQLL
jgi:hypothetical protein